MQVLAVASEVFPLVKTGGLADVTGALPLALARHGISVRTLLPGYPSVMSHLKKHKSAARLDDFFGLSARLLSGKVAGLDLFVLDCPALFDREGGPYSDISGADHSDNWLRFAALSKAGALIASGLVARFRPDIVHVHDWQAAMTPVYLRFSDDLSPPSLITIHNIAFQGQFAPIHFAGLGLPERAFALDGIEYYGDIGFLKGGLATATAITTVSPTYAQEICGSEFGMGLEGLINTRSDDLYGITNGIDTVQWDPVNDPALAANYRSTTLKRRRTNRQALIERFGLDASLPGPLLSVISRLTWQKGMDLIAETADAIVAEGVSLIILGAGDPEIEVRLAQAAARNPGRIGFFKGYNEELSHLMQGGADAILVPSRFEPCGLTQLYGLRYGCVPVVARTGGLADTVIDANEAALSAGVATGFQFSAVNRASLLHATRRVCEAFRSPTSWARMQRQGMKADVSWERSAARYAHLYAKLIEKNGS